MEIKRLSKEELSEGLTLHLVNSVNLQKKCSPVILSKGAQPVKLIVCSAGYNVMQEDGSFVKTDSNKFLVVKERDACIARSRYLVKYGQEEKKLEVADLVSRWKMAVRQKIDELKKKVIAVKEAISNEHGLAQALIRATAEQNGTTWEEVKAKLKNELHEITPGYERLEEMYSQNQFVELLTIFKIKDFQNPMFSASYENDHDMKVAKNTFGREALENWDGDILNRYAMIEVEKRYAV